MILNLVKIISLRLYPCVRLRHRENEHGMIMKSLRFYAEKVCKQIFIYIELVFTYAPNKLFEKKKTLTNYACTFN